MSTVAIREDGEGVGTVRMKGDPGERLSELTTTVSEERLVKEDVTVCGVCTVGSDTVSVGRCVVYST